MTDKIYAISLPNGHDFQIEIKTDGSTLTISLQNQTTGEVFEEGNLTLDDLYEKNKLYRQFDTMENIVEEIANKFETGDFMLKPSISLLTFKHKNELYEDEYVNFEVPMVSGASSGGNPEEVNKLKEENAELSNQKAQQEEELTRLRQENEELTNYKNAKESEEQNQINPEEYERLRQENEQLNGIKAQYEEELNSLRAQGEELNNLRQENEQLRNAGGQNEEAINQVKAQYEEELNNLRQENENIRNAGSSNDEAIKAQYEEELNRLRSESAELANIREENANLKKEIENLKSKPAATPIKPVTSIKPLSQPAKVVAKPVEAKPIEAKPVERKSVEIKPAEAPKYTPPAKIEQYKPVTFPKKPIPAEKRQSADFSHVKSRTMAFTDSHVAGIDFPKFKKDTSLPRESIYMLDRSIDYKSDGDFWHRIDIAIDRKKNLKKTLDSIEQRRNEYQKEWEKINTQFARSPTQEQKMNALNVMWKILLLYLECKEVIHLESVFSDEIEYEGMVLTPDEQVRFKQACEIFNKGLPFQQAIRYNKLPDSVFEMIYRFFTEKNLRFYAKDEIKDILEFKEKITFTKH